MSKRDILIIKLIIVVVIGGLIYYFGHIYLDEELDRLRSIRTAAASEIEAFDQDAGLIVTLNRRIPIYEALIESIAIEYTRDLEQAEYIIYLESFLYNSGILLNSFTHVTPRALPIFSRGHILAADRVVHDVMGYNSYRLSFDATNEQFLTFLRLTEESGRGFAASNLMISSDRHDFDSLTINMELRFFYLADMEEFTLDYDFSEILDNALFLEERRSVFHFLY